ncbi:hypothetical protein FNV43_RR24718 [Rhamnella rubrinervis]|uniref:Uncharacterized protein n=1 Tax=Rhamnella rubrinervis TaxID=2594499 RepID=A0A8K0GTF9_9ROSA|nr:hypothetical protein FNV43_RR24718 [Rhamnella rubrinervis]
MKYQFFKQVSSSSEVCDINGKEKDNDEIMETRVFDLPDTQVLKTLVFEYADTHCNDNAYDANPWTIYINNKFHIATKPPIIPPRVVTTSQSTPMVPQRMMASSSEGGVIELGYVYDSKEKVQNKSHIIVVEDNFEFKIV